MTRVLLAIFLIGCFASDSYACSIVRLPGAVDDGSVYPDNFVDSMCRPLSYGAILDLIESRARSEAQGNIQATVGFVGGEGQQQDVCLSTGGPFQPAPVPIPDKNSELVNRLCNVLYRYEGNPGGCEFMKFDSCEIEFRRSFALSYETNTQHLRDSGFMIVRCTPIPVAGVLPKWVCGSGVSFMVDRLFVEPRIDSASLRALQVMQRNFRTQFDHPPEPTSLNKFLKVVLQSTNR